MLSTSDNIFIVGATGFIGGRLVETLLLEHSITPTCLVRDMRKLARIARFPVKCVNGDLLRPETFEREVEGCDVYINCAYGKEKDPELNWRVNTEGTLKLLQLAHRNRAKQFIFLSTTAIYEGPYESGSFDERTLPDWEKRDYAGGKLEAERICLDFAKSHDLPVTILRPTIVYGPFAPSWTIFPVELIRKGVLKEFDDFAGVCNPVYVDDVVGAILASINNENALNEVFNVSSGETISWHDFFTGYSLAVSGKPLEKSNRLAYTGSYIAVSAVKRSVKFVFSLAPDFTKNVYRYLRSKGLGNWSWVKGEDISNVDLGFYNKRLEFRVDKLKEKLGYRPAFDFASGLRITTEWLKYYGYCTNGAT